VLVEAQDLTRYYGDFLAVDAVSFGIDRGEIVGLLGPNGAGKTTTIRMLTGFLPPSGGSAHIAGHDVQADPLQVRRHVGYMPESNPLYGEMRAAEYLAHRAELKGVPRAQRRRRMSRCMDLCGVADVAGQVIGTLSKGYRQRVGLADALLADPDVLVLDEPTIGLDPNQVRETRNLIRNLGQEHTVLISTHILAEAEAICRRVLIIDRGRIVADDTPETLSERIMRNAVVAELSGKATEIAGALRGLKGVESVETDRGAGWHRFTMATAPNADVREAVFRLASERGWALRELTRSRASLEDVFHRLTLAQENPDRDADAAPAKEG
jgi:ABC-2 type transport system ATP-binding protein